MLPSNVITERIFKAEVTFGHYSIWNEKLATTHQAVSSHTSSSCLSTMTRNCKLHFNLINKKRLLLIMLDSENTNMAHYFPRHTGIATAAKFHSAVKTKTVA